MRVVMPRRAYRSSGAMKITHEGKDLKSTTRQWSTKEIQVTALSGGPSDIDR